MDRQEYHTRVQQASLRYGWTFGCYLPECLDHRSKDWKVAREEEERPRRVVGGENESVDI